MLLHRTIEGEGLTRSGEQDELSMETAAAVYGVETPGSRNVLKEGFCRL